MSPVRRSVLYSVAEKYLTQLLAIVTMVVMARLLTPAETGLYLIAGGLILLVESFRDFGVVPFLVREHSLSQHAVRTAFTISPGLVVRARGGALLWRG